MRLFHLEATKLSFNFDDARSARFVAAKHGLFVFTDFCLISGHRSILVSENLPDTGLAGDY